MDAADLATTPLYEAQKLLGARFVPFAGWKMPVQYQGIVAEHHAVRRAVGLFDVSHMGELQLRGADALAVLQHLVTSDIAKLAVGQGRYTLCCHEDGGIVDDLIVYRTGEERYLTVCNAGNRAKVAAVFAQACAELANGRCEFDDCSDDYALLALQGPRAVAVLAAAGASDASNLPRFSIAEIQVGGVSCWVARSGYTGEDGFELFCAPSQAVDLWQRLLESGAAHGLVPVGLGARDTLRLEARLHLYGQDIDDTTNPWEAGLGWTLVLDGAAGTHGGGQFIGKGDYRGRSALLEFRERGWSRQLVGLEMVGRGIARHGYRIFTDPMGTAGSEVGTVTSGAPSPTLGKNIALGYVPRSHRDLGTRLWVGIRDQHVEASVVSTPFYRRHG